VKRHRGLTNSSSAAYALGRREDEDRDDMQRPERGQSENKRRTVGRSGGHDDDGQRTVERSGGHDEDGRRMVGRSGGQDEDERRPVGRSASGGRVTRSRLSRIASSHHLPRYWSQSTKSLPLSNLTFSRF
jgi:hypothetical protein